MALTSISSLEGHGSRDAKRCRVSTTSFKPYPKSTFLFHFMGVFYFFCSFSTTYSKGQKREGFCCESDKIISTVKMLNREQVVLLDIKTRERRGKCFTGQSGMVLEAESRRTFRRELE